MNIILIIIKILLSSTFLIFSQVLFLKLLNINYLINNNKLNVKHLLILVTPYLAISAIIYFINFIWCFNFVFVMLFICIINKLIFKVKYKYSGFLFLAYSIISMIAEILIVIIFELIFGKDYDYLNSSNMYSFYTLFTHTLISLYLMLALYKKIRNKFFKVNLTVTENKMNKALFILIISSFPTYFLILLTRYNIEAPIMFVILLLMIISLTYSILYIESNAKFMKQNIQYSQLLTQYNNTATMVDTVKTLKHDFNNIFQVINGYLTSKDYNSLNTFVDSIMLECKIANLAQGISSEAFDEPGIFALVGKLYMNCVKKEIKIDIDSSISYKSINFPISKLIRILGVVIDNAIEAAQNCIDNKYIHLDCRFDRRKNANILKLYNTYKHEKPIDLDKIFNKGVSSKKIKSGIGLWEVKKLISSKNNAQVYATIERDMFCLNIVIEQ